MSTSAALLDTFRRDRARGTNDDIALSLRPAYRELLSKLGDPHLALPPVFHVAGTNGKGSTCTFLRTILEAAGYSVHVYTSPHLVHFHERIRVAGELISESKLAELLHEVRDLAAPDSITYFEAATAVAFAAFARVPADFTILEVGLGGRLDATNVVPKPVATLISRLSFDHRDYLGETMQEIAREKAGIMRPDVPCFTLAQPDTGALETLQTQAEISQAPLWVEGKSWHVTKSGDGFLYRDEAHVFQLPHPSLLGEHQIHNAGLAIATLMNIPHSGVREADIVVGLKTACWPARLQNLQDGALAKLLPEKSELWLDGGHNDSAGTILAQQAAAWKQADDLPLHIICGMLSTKKPAEFLQPLHTCIASLQCVAIPDEVGSFSADDLAVIAGTIKIQNVSSAKDVPSALKTLAARNEPMRVLICGSLYLAGHVLHLDSSEN